MLPRCNRLTSDYDFNKVKKYGQGFKTRLFGISYVKTRNSKSRFGIITTNQFDKRAVYRNMVKRWFRRAIYSNLDQLLGGYDVVIVPFRAALNSNYEEISNIFNQALPKTPLLRPRIAS